MKRVSFGLMFCSVSFLALLGGGAHAQQAPDASGSQAQQEVDRSNDIIVTAQRFRQSLQEVPISVTALPAEVLEARGLNDLLQITTATPSLQVGQDNTFSIRGVGTLAFQQTVDPAVGMALDEVSLARNGLSENLFNDIAQVEVLNGPQGLLFGKNASGGLLNIVTKMPILGQTSVDGEARFELRDTTPGNSKGYIAKLNGNLPVSANSALRLNLLYQYQNPVTYGQGVGQRFNPNKSGYEVRAKYLIEPSSDLSIYFIGNYARSDGTAGLYDRTYRMLGAGSVNQPPLAADGFAAGPNLLSYRAEGEVFRTLNTYGIQGKVAYTLPNGWQLINIAAYKGYDFDQSWDQDYTTGNAASLSATNGKLSQFSNEFRVALPTDMPLSGQFGLYYLQFNEAQENQTGGSLYLPPFVTVNPPFCLGAGASPACAVRNDYVIGGDSLYDFNAKSYAAFGQFTFAVSPEFRLLAGARVTQDKVDIDLTQTQKRYLIAFNGPPASVSDSTTSTNFSYKVGVQYEPTSDLMFYGTFATGYKGPGMNNSLSAPTSSPIVDPETSDNFEAGAKTVWFDRALTFNVALFLTKYKDYQSQAFDPASGSFKLTNAASLTTKGAEVNVLLRPVKGLSFNGAATFLDAKFDDFPGANCYTGQAGCDANNTYNAKGQRTALSAKFTSSIGVTYETSIGGDASLSIGGDWYHRSSINFSPSSNPDTFLDGIDLFGVNLGLNLNDNLRFSIYCKNCTDKRVPNFIYGDPGDSFSGVVSTIQTFGYNSVRNIGASVNFNF